MNDKIHICYSDTKNIYTVRLHSTLYSKCIIPNDFNGLMGRVFTQLKRYGIE